jgi:predicted ATPase
MAKIEGFRVQNFRTLKDVTVGKLSNQQQSEALGPFTVVIGRNGAGKSSLFDAFGFIADCLASDVEKACDKNQRGGFERLRTNGTQDPIEFEIYYREDDAQRPITYQLALDLDRSGRPYVKSETLKQRRHGMKSGQPYPFLKLKNGKGAVWAGEDAVEDKAKNAGQESDQKISIELTDQRQLGIETLGTLKEHPRIKRFRDFLKGWFLSYFAPDAARSIPSAGPQRYLSPRGDNIGNVVQFFERENKEAFKSILKRIAEKIPGIKDISTEVTSDKRVVLRFNDGAFRDPFFAQQMSDGTLKMFAYLLLLEDPKPPPLICIEEPENGLHHKLLESLAHEMRSRANQGDDGPQIFVTTHQPYFVNGLNPTEVWVIEKGKDGFSRLQRASTLQSVNELVAEGLPLGGLWHSDYLDAG